MTTTTWTGTAGDGSWQTAGNWSNGVPDETVTAILTGSSPIHTTGDTPCLSLDASNYTGTITATDNFNLRCLAGITLNPLTVIDRNIQVYSGYLNCNGARIRSALLGGTGGDLTMLSDMLLTDPGFHTNQMLTFTGGGALNFGGHTITVRQQATWSGNQFCKIDNDGTKTFTWSAGGGIVIETVAITTTMNDAINLEGDTGSTPWPPIHVTGTGCVGVYSVQPFSNLTVDHTVAALLIAPLDYTTGNPGDPGQMAVNGNLAFHSTLLASNENGDGTIPLNGVTITVGGNFTATGATMNDATAAWTLTVTGTASAVTTAFKWCNAGGGTNVNDAGGIDGGNNVNITFAPAPAPAGPSGCLMVF